MAATLAPSTPTLSRAEVEQFHREGWLGPFTMLERDEMRCFRAQVEAAVAAPPPMELNDVHAQGKLHPGHNRHIDQEAIALLGCHPNLIGRAASIVGEDLLLWRTNFFTKEPGAKEIPWHQDWNYWPLEPAIVVSAWLAIDDVTVENSCVQVIPGSHRKVLNHIKAGAEMWFSEMADTHGVDLAKKVDIELKAGEFFLFNERTLHHSEPNRSDKRRMGLAIRLITPQVRLVEWDGALHRLIQVSGQDRLGFNAPRVVPGCPLPQFRR